MQGSVIGDELAVPPPWGVISCQSGAALQNRSVLSITNRRQGQNERSLLEARLRGIYYQVDPVNIEKDFIDLAKKWNTMV